MNDISLAVNRHIVDQLADIREKVKFLKHQEEAIKDAVSQEMGSSDSLGGDEYIAVQTATERAGSIDAKAMEKDGIDVEKYRKPKTVVISIRVEKRVMEE